MTLEFDDLFKKFDRCEFYRISAGVFLVNEDACYPAIREFMKVAEDYELPYLLLPLSDSALSISPDYRDLPEWLRGMGKNYRLTRLQKPEPEKTL